MELYFSHGRLIVVIIFAVGSFHRKRSPFLPEEGLPPPLLSKELPQAARILRYAPFANGEYDDNEMRKDEI